MKSLEHLIRQVHEGKAEKGKKDSLEHAIRKVKESKRDDIDASMPKYGGFDRLNTESDLSYMGSGTGGEPKMHAEDGKKKKVEEQEVDMSFKSPADKLRLPKDMTGGPFGQPGPVLKYHPMFLPKNLRTATSPKTSTDEAVGSIGTDDYKGNQPFRATPHIKPPGPTHGHSQAPENVSRQRTLAKEKTSMTMHNKVNEASSTTAPAIPSLFKSVKLPGFLGPIGAFVGVASKAVPYIQKMIDVSPEELERARKAISTSKFAPGVVEPETPTGPKAPPVPPAVPAPVAPTGPKAPPVPAPVAPGVPARPSTVTKTTPKVLSPTIEISPVKKTGPEPKPKVAMDMDTSKKVATPTDVSSEKTRIPAIGIPTTGQIPHELRGVSWTTHPIAHKAKKHKAVRENVERKSIQNVPRPDAGDRHNVELVGRKNSDPKTSKEKTSRQASYNINVIDENRRLSGIVMDTVKQKRENMKSKTEDGIGQSSKVIQYPNGTRVLINPEMTRTTMDIDGKLPNDYK